MDSTLKEEKGCQRLYRVTCPWEEVAETWHHVVREVRHQAKIPGFRPGKAPESMIKGRFKKEIRDEVLEHFLPDAARKVAKEHGLEPVVEPYAADIHLEEGEPFTCEIALEMAPVVPALDTAGLSVECRKLEVNPEQIERTLEGMRERAAVMKPVDEAAEGDYAVVQLRRAGAGKAQEQFFQARAASDHPVEKILAGRKPGDTFTVVVGAPAEGAAQKAPLAEGEYSIEVTRLVRREIPSLGDDLAKDLGAADLADLRAKVEAGLKSQAEAAMRSEQRERVMERLLERHPFPVPPTLVDRQVREDLEHFAEELAHQGVDLEKAPIEWDKIADQARPGAEKKVRAFYLVDAFVAAEKVEVSDADLEGALEERARAAGVPVAQVKARYAKEGGMESLRKGLAHGRAVDLLLSKASVTFTAAPAAAPGGPDAPHSHGGGADEPR